VEIPKTMIVERIRSRGSPEMADRADREPYCREVWAFIPVPFGQSKQPRRTQLRL
jgi:hypothetical protein